MKISRFFGITTREAMREVRLALGPDALIVSNRRVEGGVEILATDSNAIPDEDGQVGAAASAPAPAPAPSPAPAPVPTIDPATATARPLIPSPMSPLGAYAAAFQAAYGSDASPQVQHQPQPEPQPQPQPQARKPQPELQQGQPEPQPQPEPSPPQAIWPATAAQGPEPDTAPENNILDVIGDMRGALESRMEELMWGNQLRTSPQAASLFQTMLGFGFSTALLRVLLKSLPRDVSGRRALQWVRDELVSHLPMLDSEDTLWKPGLVLALVGPTGVGKTTTIAKLAARCVRRFGPDKLVLITTDTYRIGAHEQLKIYGQLLRVPVHIVRSADELRDVVAGVRPDQVILIDNVGISQRDRYIHEQAALLAAAGREVTRLLALNAASHGETLDEVARRYAADGGTPIRGCIITKVDEATRLGAALDTALRYRLPIHYVSIGQKVPEHLVFLSAQELVDRALMQQPSERALFAPTEADFAALLSMSRPAAQSSATDGEVERKRMLALPRLLSMTAGGAAHLSEEDLRRGCAYIEELDSVAEAYAAWRGYVSQQAGEGKKPASAEGMLRGVRNAWAARSNEVMLAMHDHTSLRASGEPGAQIRATLVLDQRGTAIASTMQQLALTQGWLSSCGQASPKAPSSRDALLLQVQWLAEHAGELPLVHLFEGGNASLWRELVEGKQAWMALVPAITRVDFDDGATTVQALAKTLAHQPVTDPIYLSAFSAIAGVSAEETALWFASTPVTVAARGREPLKLNMVSALVLDRCSGKRLKQIIGLHHGLESSLEKLAAWLVIKSEGREAVRHAARSWQLMQERDAGHSILDQASLVAQVGLAAWELQKHPAAKEGRALAASMMGRKQLATNAAAAATLKLFALKEMLGA